MGLGEKNTDMSLWAVHICTVVIGADGFDELEELPLYEKAKAALLAAAGVSRLADLPQSLRRGGELNHIAQLLHGTAANKSSGVAGSYER